MCTQKPSKSTTRDQELKTMKVLKFIQHIDSSFNGNFPGLLELAGAPKDKGLSSGTAAAVYFTGWIQFLIPNEQRKSTEGKE